MTEDVLNVGHGRDPSQHQSDLRRVWPSRWASAWSERGVSGDGQLPQPCRVSGAGSRATFPRARADARGLVRRRGRRVGVPGGAGGRGGRAWPSIRPRSRPTCAPQGRRGPRGPPAGFPQLSHFAPNSYPRLRTPSLPRTALPCPSVLRRLEPSRWSSSLELCSGVRGELPSQCCLNPYKRWEYRGGSHY